MHKTHALAFDQLEQSKEALLSKLAQRDYTDIATRKNNKWSPLEQCYHVYLAEMYSRKYCEKKLSFNPTLKNAGVNHRFRIWVLKAMELAPIKFKAPKTINEQVFPDNLNLKVVSETWAADRQELKTFLESLDPSLIKKEIYKQPSVGRLTIGGMLEFFQFHQDRHEGHIRRQYGIGR